MKVYSPLIEAQLEVATQASKTVAKKGLFLFDSTTGAPVYSDGTSFRPLGGGESASRIVRWSLQSDSPTEIVEDGVELLEFTNVVQTGLWASMLVPLDYVAGTQILLRGGKLATAQVSGVALFKATTYLVKSGTAVIGDRSKSWLSLNPSTSIHSVANTVTAIGDIDLTSSTGKVKNPQNDDVPVAAGDLLIVNLVRAVASELGGAAGVVRVLPHSFSIKFVP